VGRRGLAPEVLAAGLAQHMPVEPIEDARAALRAALSRAGPDHVVLVTGSLFLVGEAYAELQEGRALFEAWHAGGSGGTEAHLWAEGRGGGRASSCSRCPSRPRSLPTRSEEVKSRSSPPRRRRATSRCAPVPM